MMKEHYRQGDLLIERIEALPAGAEKCKPVKGRIVLALGEATGHDHSIQADKADWWKADRGSDQFVQVRRATQLVHQEHSAIDLAPGTYRVRRQREYSPGAIRQVAD